MAETQDRRAPDPGDYPEPEVEGYDVSRDSDGDVTSVTVAVSYWDQDDTRIEDVPFRVRDGRARFKSMKVDRYYLPSRDLVPLIVASEALQDANISGVQSVQSIRDLVEDALDEAARADVGGSDD